MKEAGESVYERDNYLKSAQVIHCQFKINQVISFNTKQIQQLFFQLVSFLVERFERNGKDDFVGLFQNTIDQKHLKSVLYDVYPIFIIIFCVFLTYISFSLQYIQVFILSFLNFVTKLKIRVSKCFFQTLHGDLQKQASQVCQCDYQVEFIIFKKNYFKFVSLLYVIISCEVYRFPFSMFIAQILHFVLTKILHKKDEASWLKSLIAKVKDFIFSIFIAYLLRLLFSVLYTKQCILYQIMKQSSFMQNG
eukprot:TRINITY_DN8174_c0_g1_i1.p2 TRINITY_DN8174_c0_g1~~TRINITY_DN8174_c0_g1_i1.p2  ORF type:complete len:249 (-),score=-5.81 TRINITY_DN8174_c0_g1_i1:910-1656(-)